MESFDLEGYTIIRTIQRGGMTDLYVAHDLHRKRFILRVMKEANTGDRRLKKSFLRSAEMLKRFNHPNIIKAYGWGIAHHRPYMIMDYIESTNLRDLILHKDQLVAANHIPLILQIAAAIYYVHSAGYLHLDIKPENILITDEGEVILIDFDLMTLFKGKSLRIKNLPGTPTYMAPETYHQEIVNEQSDIFAFGLTAYELITYRRPFESNRLETAKLNQVSLTYPAAPMSQYKVKAPKALERIVLKCLAKKEVDRYPSMSLVIKDLEELL